MRRRFLLLVSALLVPVVACGGGDGDTPAAEGRELDRCSLITTQEAAAWLGEPVTASPSESLGEVSPVTCLYEGANATVLVQVRDGSVYFAEPGSQSRTGEDVEGIGEDAFIDSDGIEILQNDWSVSIGRITGVVEEEALLEMARVVSDRLP